MSDILNWLGGALAGLLTLAVAVAGWEYLRRPTLPQPPAGTEPGSELPATEAASTLLVDLPLEPLQPVATADGEPQASHKVMSWALTRAAVQARTGRDGLPWLDTQPRVALGVLEEAGPAIEPEPEPTAEFHGAQPSDAAPKTVPGALPEAGKQNRRASLR